MADILYPHPMLYDISITLSIYDNWQQVSRRKFPLRNLEGQTEAEQIDHARQIMNGVASELHHITSLGIDKGVIHIGKKKVDEVLYPGKTPAEFVKWFRYGVNISFYPVFTYQWRKDGSRNMWRISADKLDEGWQPYKWERVKKVSFRLPVHLGNSGDAECCIRYVSEKKRGRKVTGWIPYCDRKRDVLYNQFLQRFYDDGHLCIGEKRYWGKVSNPVEMKGVFWKPPKFGTTKFPRKGQIASRPTDETDYVYLIRMGRTKMYKIGKTNDPQGRLASLQTASPYKLKLLHTFKADNASAAEESLHAKFHDVRLEGEWFKLTDAERDAIVSVLEFRENGFVVDAKDGSNKAVSLSVDDLFGQLS